MPFEQYSMFGSSWPSGSVPPAVWAVAARLIRAATIKVIIRFIDIFVIREICVICGLIYDSQSVKSVKSVVQFMIHYP